MNMMQPQLRDLQGRRFTYLRLSITDQCNFRCSYCLPNGYQPSDIEAPLSLDEITRLVEAFAAMGTQKVRITGGEPSLRKDLTEIIDRVSNTPGIEQTAITSNGYRLEHQVDDWVSAGLNRLNLSIDSLSPQRFESITGHSKLNSLLKGLERSLELGLDVKVNAVLLKGFNDQELNDFLRWVKNTPVTLRFIELMQTGGNQVFFSEHHIRASYIQQKLLEDGWTMEKRGPHEGPAVVLRHPDYIGKLGLIMPYSKDFCTSCNRLRITAQGKLHLCLFGDQGYSIRPFLSDSSSSALKERLQMLLADKKPTHYLEQGHTGATQHFAMLGG